MRNCLQRYENQQPYGLHCARMAAEIVNNLDYPPRNYAGHVLGTSGGVPFLLPDEAVRPSDSDINAAMASYYMTPLVVNGSNMLAIESGRTTAKPSATSIRTASPTLSHTLPGSQPTSMRSAPAARSRRASASSSAAVSRGAWLISAMISMSWRP